MKQLAPFAEALADRYRIEREIGAGGMATVYLAHDVRHGRKVALKVLRPELALALGPERFLAEVRLTARLQHPHLVPLFDSGVAEGYFFYVMPFVEGETLHDRLARERQLPLDETLRISREVGGALQYAHDLGVVHRDVKPANILLTGGHALIADFGVARAVRAATSDRLTESGMVVGTPSYMSPEQAMAEADIGARSDQYSLACVIYEMLAGEPPFTGPTAQVILVRRLTAPVPSLRVIREGVPEAVERALERALARAPADRFPGVKELVDALVAPVQPAPRLRSIAVLPFVNLSAAPENEYFADGITEDVIAQLAKVRTLDVISRTSVMRFKGHTQGIRDVAAQLQVATILEGSVRRAGDRVRIVAQLIDATTDQHLWAETYDRDLTDIFAIQLDVALNIAAALRAELSPDETARIGREPTNDLRAYQLYLQGRRSFSTFSESGLRRAITNFEAAVARDPQYAMACVGVAMALTELGESGAIVPEQAYPRARAAVARALALDPELGDAHTTAGYLKYVYEFDWDGAEKEFKRALELNPGSADAYDFYGRLCGAIGRHDEAIALLERAQQLDPLVHRVDVATAYLRAGRYDAALDAAHRAVLIDAGDPRGHFTLGWALIGTGSVDAGLAEMERAVALAPGDTLWLGQIGQAYAQAGKRDQALRVLHDLEALSRTRYVAPYHLAYVYTGLGEQDRAMDHLEQAYERRSGAVYGIGGSFLFAPLRANPRFTALLRKMHLA
ncbi:MAG: protein kinase domain-containing protein [Gemmatimonadaceae bacterium]